MQMKLFFASGQWKKSLAFISLMLAILACSISPAGTQIPSVSSTAQARLTPANQYQQVKIPMRVGYCVKGSFYEIYFTDPFNPASSKNEGGPDEPLAAAINDARI